MSDLNRSRTSPGGIVSLVARAASSEAGSEKWPLINRTAPAPTRRTTIAAIDRCRRYRARLFISRRCLVLITKILASFMSQTGQVLQ